MRYRVQIKLWTTEPHPGPFPRCQNSHVWGWTEAQAQSASDQFQVLYQSYRDTEKGQLQDQLSGWCKIIVRNDGQIAGAHVVGSAAAEIIHLISIAMKQHCPISELVDSAAFTSSYGSIVGQAGQQWRRK